MSNNFNIPQQTSSKTFDAFQGTINETLASNFNYQAPPETMACKVNRAGKVEHLCDKMIRKAHEEGEGKLIVRKYGAIIDDNGHRVEAFAFEVGRIEVEGTLYTCFAVDMLYGTVYLLMVRSDVAMDFHKLFPNIATAQDWKPLRKCIDRFSPKASCHRYVIDFRSARHSAAETAAASYLAQSGVFQQRDLDILWNMDSAKLHMLDLNSIIALRPTFPAYLIPRITHVIVTRDANDMEEVQRVFRAWDFSAGTQPAGSDVPSILIKGKRDMDMWRRSPRFTYMVYNKAQGPDCLFAAMSQASALRDDPFSEQFPHVPVIVGPSIWSDRSCVEIDIRDLRFSDEELLVGRKYLATLLKHHSSVMEELAISWQKYITTPNAAITPYPRLWYQAFHYAIGMALFSASNELMDYLELTRNADAHRLRMRTDRAQRYADAIEKLRTATGTELWLYSSKPKVKAEAFHLLKNDYDAFIHHLQDGTAVMAFTEASLARCVNLERSEIEDFVLKLKENHLLTNKTHPITFQKGEQARFICINIASITVTAGNREGR